MSIRISEKDFSRESEQIMWGLLLLIGWLFDKEPFNIASSLSHLNLIYDLYVEYNFLIIPFCLICIKCLATKHMCFVHCRTYQIWNFCRDTWLILERRGQYWLFVEDSCHCFYQWYGFWWFGILLLQCLG